MDKKLTKIIACPNCKLELAINEKSLVCNKCNEKYKLVNGIPIFTRNTIPDEEFAAESFRSNLRKHPGFLRLFRKIHAIVGPPISNYRGKDPIERANRKGLTLNIGSSSKKAYENSINLDIGLFNGVDIVADGKNLPFKDNSFSLVIIEMVLEHVDEPEAILKEAHRVLKKNGEIYVTIPFVFAFHGSPNDFNRYTLNGLKRRLEIQGFKIKESGVISGPASTFSQVSRYFLSTLFSFNNDFLFSLMLNIFGWLTFPIKYLDIFLNKSKKAHLIASAIYARAGK